MLMDEYSYETDIEVQREEAAKEAKEKADKRLVEIIEKVSKNFHVSLKDACEKLGESYQEYLEIKKSLPPDIHK